MADITKEDLGLNKIKEEIDIMSAFLNLYLKTDDKSRFKAIINELYLDINGKNKANSE